MAAWLQQVRDRAGAWVRELAIPTKRDEEWRFTDISPLFEVNFQGPQPVNLDALDIDSFVLPEAKNTRLVFVNGVFAPNHSSVAGLPEGVFVGNLGQLPDELSARVGNYLGKQQGGREVFTSLNTAGLTDAAVVWVPKHKIVEESIHLLFIASPTEGPILTQRRCLVVAEAGSAVQIVEHCVTAEIGCPDLPPFLPYLTNTVMEVWVEENAEVKHTRVQRDGGAAYHIGKTAVGQARNSRYACNAVSLGAKLSRHNLEVYQTGEGTETNLQGLTVVNNQQLADTHSSIVLNHPHGSSNQVHKCIVDDKARAVFNGKIFVAREAQLTNASQLNRNLLLSKNARVDTKPQLEIIADNVKCAHGATVSELDGDRLFYLQSRGLDKATCRDLLIDAFAGEIIEKLPINSLRKMISQCVACRM
jgi:Fe-S cluster assembly protein SufD